MYAIRSYYGLVSSLAAREVIVGTLGTLNGIDGDERSLGLQEALKQDLTPGGAVALLVFFAFAMQCMSTVAMVRQETGGWKIPIFQFTYMGALAYVGALLANHLVITSYSIHYTKLYESVNEGKTLSSCKAAGVALLMALATSLMNW